jgi:YD repeat-containing protein
MLWYVYDNHNRLTTIKSGYDLDHLSVVTSFGYDTESNPNLAVTHAQGRMTTATNNGYTWHYSYDVMGRANKQTLETPFLINGSSSTPGMMQAAYTYDSDGKLTSMSYPGNSYEAGSNLQPGASVTYAYDGVGRPTGMQDGQGHDIASNASYNAAGQILGWQEYDYTTLTRSYDPARGWMTSQSVSQSQLNLTYGYNANGQVTTITDSVNPGQAVTSYTYDNLNRLSSATTPNWTMAWTLRRGSEIA